jgi:hypothetical protein
MDYGLKLDSFVLEDLYGKTLTDRLNQKYHITCLYLAKLAWRNVDTVIKDLTDMGATKIKFYDSLGVQGYFAEFDDVAVVAFRATEWGEAHDLKIDFTFWKTDFRGLKAHKGFATAIQKVLPEIEADLALVPPTKRVLYTGHSLGGALAAMLAVVRKPTDLCTFGQPRIFGGTIPTEIYQGVNYHRVVVQWDWVRLIPPNIPFLLSYKHAGIRRLLKRRISFSVLWAGDHNLSTYLELLVKEDGTLDS